jgi:hypothetical protein
MPLTTTEKNAVLDYIGSRITHFSGHSADPGASGTSELAGGSYARVAASWNAAASANLDHNGSIVINVPAGSDLAYIGYWSASSGGTFRGSKSVTNGPISFPVAGTYTLTDADFDFS